LRTGSAARRRTKAHLNPTRQHLRRGLMRQGEAAFVGSGGWIASVPSSLTILLPLASGCWRSHEHRALAAAEEAGEYRHRDTVCRLAHRAQHREEKRAWHNRKPIISA